MDFWTEGRLLTPLPSLLILPPPHPSPVSAPLKPPGKDDESAVRPSCTVGGVKREGRSALAVCGKIWMSSNTCFAFHTNTVINVASNLL